MTEHFLAALTPEAIAQGPFPLDEVVGGSLFYPASGTDGSPIRHWPLGICSFVYADWSVDSTKLEVAVTQRTPSGYRVLGMRELGAADLTPKGWKPKPPATVEAGSYLALQRMAGATSANAFGRWHVFEREANRDDKHGPARFSLLFLRAEGVAAYQALYESNGLRPEALAVLRPGTSFGGNFGGFEQALLEVLRANPLGMPPWLMQWHAAGEGTQPAGLWAAHYGERARGPYSKDGEEGRWQFSVYPARATPQNAAG
jgi:hypothetical protein